jgi:hypothetical protein
MGEGIIGMRRREGNWRIWGMIIPGLGLLLENVGMLEEKSGRSGELERVYSFRITRAFLSSGYLN